MEKSKVMMVGREGVAPHLEVEMNREILEVVSSFKFLLSFSKDEGSQEDVKLRD